MDPALYGDSRTRLTTYWTVRTKSFSLLPILVFISTFMNISVLSLICLQVDNFGNTGCFNSVWPGFVQVHPRIHLGSPYNNTSVIRGQQFVTDIWIAQVIHCPLK